MLLFSEQLATRKAAKTINKIRSISSNELFLQSVKLVQMNQISRKEKIIKKSLQLFNNKGVENTTTRHIAKALEISQGNLHYHYPNKNEILLVLFDDMLEELETAKSFTGDALNPSMILTSMQENFKIMYKYRLFFQQNEVVWRRIPKIRKDMKALYQNKHTNILALINAYNKVNKLRPGIDQTQMETLAEQMVFFIQSWLVVKHYKNSSKPIEYYARFLFRIWLPYLELTTLKQWEKHIFDK